MISLPIALLVHAPAFNILGSYFPAWLFCALSGIVLAVLFRLLIVWLQLDDYVRPAVFTYPCSAALFTFTLWLLFFN